MIIEELDELLEMGFRGREASQVEEMVDVLNRIEDETDELGIDITRQPVCPGRRHEPRVSHDVVQVDPMDRRSRRLC